MRQARSALLPLLIAALLLALLPGLAAAYQGSQVQQEPTAEPTPVPDDWSRIQDAGKAVQVWYNLHYTTHVVNVFDEVATLCTELDPARLFIGADVATAEAADALVEHARRVCRDRRGRGVSVPR